MSLAIIIQVVVTSLFSSFWNGSNWIAFSLQHMLFPSKTGGMNVERQREELSKVGGLDCRERQGFPLWGNRKSQGADGILYLADAWLSVWTPVSISDWLPTSAHLVVVSWEHWTSEDTPTLPPFFELDILGWSWTCSVARDYLELRILLLLSEDWRCLLLHPIYVMLVLNPGTCAC